jgi:hypothetical protein
MEVGWSHYHTTLILNRGGDYLQLLRQKAPKGLSINQRHPFWRRSQHHSPRLWKAGVGTSLRELHVAGWEEGSCVGETGSGMVREDNP